MVSCRESRLKYIRHPFASLWHGATPLWWSTNLALPFCKILSFLSTRVLGHSFQGQAMSERTFRKNLMSSGRRTLDGPLLIWSAQNLLGSSSSSVDLGSFHLQFHHIFKW